MHKEILIARNLSIGILDELISGINFSLSNSNHVGIIGPNGSGKTTLLKTLAGIEESYSGSLVRKGSCEYVAQTNHTKEWHHQNLGEYCLSQNLQSEKVILFLKENFNFFCTPSDPMFQFSGGQQSLVFLSCAFLKNPSVLLLDEPTNHLDIHARVSLVRLIKNFKGCVLCVSHDVWFLEKITNILWIIEKSKIRLFKGSYVEYKDELIKNQQSRARKLEVAYKEKRKLVISEKRENIRKARSHREGNLQKHDRSMSRTDIGRFKNAAEKTAARNKKVLDVTRYKIEEKIENFSSRKKKEVSGSIISGDQKAAIFHIRNASLVVGGKTILSNINLDLYSRERIALLGKNGSGKSSFVKSFLGKKDYSLVPEPYVNKKMRIEYLDQHYSFVDLEKSVLENVLDFSSVSEERARQHLSHFLFQDIRDLQKKAKELSGGMTARLAFVMLTIAPIDLLILDEPTNNLDMETIDEIITLLEEYHGALMVISHDIDFLERLHIDIFYSLGETFKSFKVESYDSLEDFI